MQFFKVNGVILNGFNNQKMARLRIKVIFMLMLFLLATATVMNAQITAPLAKYEKEIHFDENVYIFCSDGPESENGALTANSYSGDSSSFIWEKYDTLSNTFLPFDGYISKEDTLQSTISNLGNGLYRVTIHSGGTVKEYQAHVINNWIEVTKAEIPDSSSTCDGFQIWSDYTKAPLSYFDNQTGKWEKITRRTNKPFAFYWKGDDMEYYVQNPYSPPIPSEDPIPFNLTITDEFECIGKGSVDYISKVPKSGFEADPMEGEAVLKVTFNNSSINYDSILWCFYKSDSILSLETEENDGNPIDSIDFVLLEKSPVYEYEWTGKYLVKVITVHVNPTTGNCYDTLHMKSGTYIDVFESLVEAPNVITPNGDGMNDVFVVKSQSLKSMTIHIYNRWGGLVHSWSYSNIRGRDYTYEHSVWDGKIGSRMASPGVYFYVIRAIGRDGAKQNKEGFFHLFRNKD